MPWTWRSQDNLQGAEDLDWGPHVCVAKCTISPSPIPPRYHLLAPVSKGSTAGSKGDHLNLVWAQQFWKEHWFLWGLIFYYFFCFVFSTTVTLLGAPSGSHVLGHIQTAIVHPVSPVMTLAPAQLPSSSAVTLSVLCLSFLARYCWPVIKSGEKYHRLAGLPPGAWPLKSWLRPLITLKQSPPGPPAFCPAFLIVLQKS